MPKLWKRTIGPHGAKVTVKERTVGGPVYLFAWDPELEGYRKRSLGFPVRDASGKLIKEAENRAKREATELSNRLLQGDSPSGAVTVRELFSLFRREELPDMTGKYRKETERGLALLEAFLGSAFQMEKLGPREWNAFKRQRASGEIDAKGIRVPNPEDRRPVSPRTVAKDLKTLRQVCRFGAAYRRRDGSFLLSTDPTRGLDLPSEKNPARPVADDERYEALLQVADQVHPFLSELLVLAGETGRRIGSIVALRYSDWMPDRGTYGTIRWRADSDKLGKEWTAPVTPAVRDTMERILQDRPGIGDAFLFPAPKSDTHVDVTLASRWFRIAEKEAGLEHKDWGGWHMLRRRWATKRKGQSLKDVAYVGGWKGTQVLQEVYQHADDETMEAVVLGGAPLRATNS
ncbi:tyrosine-type recombinase/integrase [Gemmatimonadota bacterium]